MRRYCPVLLALLCAWANHSAYGVVLNWNSETWTPNGALSQSFDVTPNNPGNDLTISFSGNTGSLVADPVTGFQTPALTNSLQGGQGGTPNSLEVATSLASAGSITVTISFAQIPLGVDNVHFTLFDIDQGTRSEIVSNISATGIDGTTIFYPTISAGSAVSLTGSGATQTLTGIAASPDTGAGSANGNGDFTFNSGGTGVAIQSLSFTFATSSGTASLQQFAISDMSFTLVPEINPAWISVASCMAACASICLHRSRVRKKR